MQALTIGTANKKSFEKDDRKKLEAKILQSARTNRLKRGNGEDRPRTRKFELLGVSIDNVTMGDALDSVMQSLNQFQVRTTAKIFSFVNADCVNLYTKDKKYRNILNSNYRVFADGVGVRIAAKWAGEIIKDNVNGTDLFPLLCEKLCAEKKRVFLYGAKPQVVKAVAQRLNSEFPGLKVVGYQDGYQNSDNPEMICTAINRSEADIVFVALGAPRQEKWIAANQHLLNVKAVMGVGGLFDFYSGAVSRAPFWLRKHSLEWVWRLIQQPQDKARRYLIGNPVFLIRVFNSAFLSKIPTQFEKWLAIQNQKKDSRTNKIFRIQ